MSSANLNIKITATIDNRGGAVSSTRRYSSTNVSISISSPCSPWTRTGRSVATVVSQREEATGKPNLRRGTLGGQRWHRGRLWRMNVARPATADRTGCDHSTSEALSRPVPTENLIRTVRVTDRTDVGPANDGNVSIAAVHSVNVDEWLASFGRSSGRRAACTVFRRRPSMAVVRPRDDGSCGAGRPRAASP